MSPPKERWTIIPPRVAQATVHKNLWADNERWHVHCQHWDTADCYKITAASPLALRRAVWLLAVYFRREFGYDFLQYGHCGHENDPRHVAFLWLGGERIRLARNGFASDRIAVGACCFRWREWREGQPTYALQWVWFHPFARRRGFLADCWPAFCAAFSPFYVEGPLSHAMRGFLLKMGTHCERGIQIYNAVVERALSTPGG